jgi:hypothetical protein
MSEPTIVLEELARELSTYAITGTLVAPPEFPNGIPLASLVTVTLTLYDVTTGDIINGVDHVDILNTDRGVIGALGAFTITLHPGDNPILDDTLTEEAHRALLEFEYNLGLDGGKQRIEIRVVNFEKVP